MHRAASTKGVLLGVAAVLAAACSFDDYADLSRCVDGRCASGGDAGADAPLESDAAALSDGGEVPADGGGDAPSVPDGIAFLQAHADNLGADDDITFPNPVTKGSTLIVVINYDVVGGGISQLVDSFGNVYKLVQLASPSAGTGTAIYYANNDGAGANTVHLEFVASVFDFAEVYIHEYTGLAAADTLDQYRFTFGSSTTFESATSGLVETKSPNQLLFSFGASGPMVAGVGWFPRSQMNGNVTQDRIVNATGDYEATGTPSGDWLMMIATFHAR